MTLGELYDKLKEIEHATLAVEAAEQSIGYGGSVETMEGKRTKLEMEQHWLESLRSEKV